MRGYRELPVSFINIWKIGNIISDASGNGDCEIIDIIDIQDLDKSKIKEYNNFHLPKVFCIDRPSLSSIVRRMKVFCKHPQVQKEFGSFNIKVSDVNYKNISKSFTAINVNGKKHSTKIIKRNKYNTLSFTYISKYIEEDIKSIEVILSIIDSKYNVSLENREVVLFKNDKEYTLEILHSISFKDIFDRLPKYMALKTKYKDVYIEDKATPPVSNNKSEVKLENIVTDLDEVIKTTFIADTSLEGIEQKLNEYWREEATKNNTIESDIDTASNSPKTIHLEELEQELNEHWQRKQEKELEGDFTKTTKSDYLIKLQQRLKKHWEEKESKEIVEEKASKAEIEKTERQLTVNEKYEVVSASRYEDKATIKNYDTDKKSIFYIVDDKINNHELFNKIDAEIIICSNKIYDKNIYLTIDEIESQLRVKRTIVRNKRDKFLLTLQEGLKIVDTLNEDLYLKYEIDSNTNFIEIQDYNLELINKKNNTNFSKEFATCILAANMHNDFVLLGKVDDVMRLEKQRVTNRHLWNNLYLIRKTIAEKFKFVHFVEDVFNRVSKYGLQSYSLYFNGYISNFLIEENITLLKLVFPIAEKIINDEFDLDINEHDEITFEKRY